MKKTILTLTAVVLSATAVPAYAGTLQGEVLFGDVRAGPAVDNTEYDVQYWAPATSFANYGVEVQTKQGANAGAVDSKISVKVGPKLPDVLGFRTAAYGELGRSIKQGLNSEFWGGGVKLDRQIYGPVSASVGYRHRESFNGARPENRLNGGLSYDVGSGNAIGVQYYRTTGAGTIRNDQIGIGITHTF